MTDLKPCPFCGGETSIRYYKDKYSYYVECNHCMACSGYSSFEDGAVKKWNTRQPAIDWKPIEELTENEIKPGMDILFYDSRYNLNNRFAKSYEGYVVATAFKYDSTFKFVRHGNWSCKFNELPLAFTRFAEITPPEVK